MRSDFYQLTLITLGLIATAMFGVFLWRELYPEYKIYQNDYVELEKFRSSYTGEPVPPFSIGIKQIVLEREDKGPPLIDRCISCHVALEIPYFSPTKIAYDVNGNIRYDAEGIPVKEPNPDYIWGKVDARIAELTDVKVNDQLKEQGAVLKYRERISEAEKLKALKSVSVDDQDYDVKKVLSMHPLIGKETRPFEYHPIAEYGCTSCHNGNGRGLTTQKAHGPTFDGTYEIEFMGPVTHFLEPDEKNDPKISRVFNNKPGPALAFQTQPIYVGQLIEAKCMQCHSTSSASFLKGVDQAIGIAKEKEQISKNIKNALVNEEEALTTLIKLKKDIETQGLGKTLSLMQKKLQDYSLPPATLEAISSQIKFLRRSSGVNEGENVNEQEGKGKVLIVIDQQMSAILGSSELAKKIELEMNDKKQPGNLVIAQFIEKHLNDPQATGTLFKKAAMLELEDAIFRHVKDTQRSFDKALKDQADISTIQSEVDLLTRGYQHGKDLYISQACYACHRIAGFARGGVGPELTNEGSVAYPWDVKEKIMWPQGTLKTSTMPNYKLDHEEIEPILTFVLAQTGENKSVSDMAYKTQLREWEAGSKMPWEKPITPVEMYDLNYSMTVFATQGCASCHRLKGFVSDVGFKVEKDAEKKPDFNSLYKEREWFTKLFPEEISGSNIVKTIDRYHEEIDQHIVDHVRQNSLLEEITKKSPQTIESFYTNFRFAARAKNDEYSELLENEKDPEKKLQIENMQNEWKERVHRILMVYIQEYGLGRLIGPRPNWSGVYRSDEWLMEHFKKPSAHVARSIMPVFPFDETKFYALTHMLDVLAKKNRDELREVWEHRGFNPEMAYMTLCSQCHGNHLQGNGPVSDWIYPIPKNLHNAEFLRNYTKDRVISALLHGVKGTPMPPWGEVASDKPMMDHIPVLNKGEIRQLTDWLFQNLPGGSQFNSPRDVPKWLYTPEDILKELEGEGGGLKAGSVLKGQEHSSLVPDPIFPEESDDEILSLYACFPSGKGLYASLEPMVNSSAITPDPEEIKVSDIFDVHPNQSGDLDKSSYYIKKKFYTQKNLADGKDFFELNCSVCHGTEGDGSGVRSGVMQDAKPRMLINLDWLQSRDDLRLIRSIKYGVPGTSMTPWGDLTTSLQRMQLVMFIRSLSEENEERRELSTALYKTFSVPDRLIEEARVSGYRDIAKLQKELESAQSEQSILVHEIANRSDASDEAVKVYKQILTITSNLQKYQNIDKQLLELKNEINEESKIYTNIGLTYITNGLLDSFNDFLKMLELDAGRYRLQNGSIVLEQDAALEKKISELADQMIAIVAKHIEELKKELTIAQGKIFSAERTKEVSTLTTEMNKMSKLKIDLISSFEAAVRSRKKQAELYEKYKNLLHP